MSINETELLRAICKAHNIDSTDYILLLPSYNQTLNNRIRLAFESKLHNRTGIILEGSQAQEILYLYALYEFTDKIIVGSLDKPYGRKLQNLLDSGIATMDELICDVILGRLDGTDIQNRNDRNS